MLYLDNGGKLNNEDMKVFFSKESIDWIYKGSQSQEAVDGLNRTLQNLLYLS